jgi:hypothetical protein
MATQTKHTNGTTEPSVERMQELNERLLETSRRFSKAYLDTTEKTVNGLADLEVKLADATNIEFVSTVASAHAEITRDLAGAYVSTARELLTK